jgi:hypothetical protein
VRKAVLVEFVGKWSGGAYLMSAYLMCDALRPPGGSHQQMSSTLFVEVVARASADHLSDGTGVQCTYSCICIHQLLFSCRPKQNRRGKEANPVQRHNVEIGALANNNCTRMRGRYHAEAPGGRYVRSKQLKRDIKGQQTLR